MVAEVDVGDPSYHLSDAYILNLASVKHLWVNHERFSFLQLKVFSFLQWKVCGSRCVVFYHVLALICLILSKYIMLE